MFGDDPIESIEFVSFLSCADLSALELCPGVEDCPVIEGWTFSTTIAKQDICKSETGKYETKGKVYRP